MILDMQGGFKTEERGTLEVQVIHIHTVLHDVTIIKFLSSNFHSFNTKFPKKFVKLSDDAQNSTMYTINAFVRR